MKLRASVGILICLLLLTLGFPSNRVVFTGYGKQKDRSDAHVLTKSVRLSFPMPIAEKRYGYQVFKIPDTNLMAIPGYPALPVKVVTLKFDIACRIDKLNASIKSRALDGRYNILPFPQPEPLIEKKGGKPKIVPNPEIYSLKSLWPPSWYKYEVHQGIDPQSRARAKFLNIYIYPVRWVPATGRVEVASDIEITVYYREGEAPLESTSVDLLIITSSTLYDAALTLAEFKNNTGIDTVVVTAEDIYSEYTGSDEPEKIRNCIRAYTDLGVWAVLIFGDADQVPVRYAYIPDGFADDDESIDGSFVETDLYYADLDGSWDTDGDGYYGELEDEVDGYPDVILGRLPASTLEEAEILVDKIVNYQPVNDWFMRFLLLGTVTFGDPTEPEGEIVKDYIEYNILWGNFTWTKLYEESITGEGCDASCFGERF